MRRHPWHLKIPRKGEEPLNAAQAGRGLRSTVELHVRLESANTDANISIVAETVIKPAAGISADTECRIGRVEVLSRSGLRVLICRIFGVFAEHNGGTRRNLGSPAVVEGMLDEKAGAEVTQPKGTVNADRNLVVDTDNLRVF
jgi:hypothetical protein